MLSIYKASAGSGKTFTLTREYLRILLRAPFHSFDRRLPHTHILAVTFTKKATAEMKERILRELYVLANTPEKSDYLASFLSDSAIGLNTQQIQQKAQKLLIGILQDYSHFSVSTIDGFFQQVIRSFARDLGLSATYDLSLDGEEMVKQAVDDIFLRVKNAKEDNQEIMDWLLEFIKMNLDEEQKWNPNATVKDFSKALLKEQLMRRMDQIQQAFSDKQLIRSYKKQLQQIRTNSEQRVALLLQQALNIFATEEGWSKNIVDAFNKHPKLWLTGGEGKTFYKILDKPEAVYVKSATSKQQQQHLLSIYHNQLAPIFAELYDIIHSDILTDYTTAGLILPHLYTLGIIQDVDKQIQATNQQLGCLPISETNKLVHQIIDGQDSPFIYERIGQYFHHYMIDEFQDTSALQWENFSPLIYESESMNRDNLVVGDVKQSIYRFRNSDWHMLHHLHEAFPHCQQPKMGANYRTAPIVVQENEMLLQRYSQWVADQIDTLTQDTTTAEDIRHMYSPEQMNQEPKKSYKGYFHMRFFAGKDATEQRLEALQQQLQSLQKEGIDLSRVTLLTRKNEEVALLYQFLIQHNYQVQSSEGLLLDNNPIIQLLIRLLMQESKEIDPISEAFIARIFGTLTNEQRNDIFRTRQLPLYEQVQALIEQLRLHTQKDNMPYLIAFQNVIYEFSKNRVADRQSFLTYWERKKEKLCIAAPQTSNAIRIMTIHSSKGLEFDIVIIPFFRWPIMRLTYKNTLWCSPNKAPFNTLPLVAVKAEKNILRSHFAKDYMDEVVAQYTDFLNLTYVALTRPRYRLYLYGDMCSYTQKGTPSIQNIGHLISHLYKDELDEQLCYSILPEGDTALSPLPNDKEKQEQETIVLEASYRSTPINERLILRSRSEDDFATDAPLEAIDLGILMHQWMGHIHVWDDAEPALQRMMRQGLVTQQQATEMRQQLAQLQQLVAQEQHSDWFTHQYRVLREHDIICPMGNTQRPDRVMLRNQHAIVIDYKFGQQQTRSHYQQVRDYMHLIQQMGYSTEGYIIYVAHNQICKLTL